MREILLLYVYIVALASCTAMREILLPCRSRDGCVHTTYAFVCDQQSHRPAPGVCSFPSDNSGCCSTASLWMSFLSSCSSGGSDSSETARTEADLVRSFSFLTSLHGWAEGTFLLFQVLICSRDRTDRSKLRAFLQSVS